MKEAPTKSELVTAQLLVGNLLKDVDEGLQCRRWILAIEMVIQGIALLKKADPEMVRREMAAGSLDRVAEFLKS